MGHAVSLDRATQLTGFQNKRLFLSFFVEFYMGHPMRIEIHVD